MMRNLAKALGSSLLVGMTLALLGCADSGPPRLGVLLPLTGETAVYGEPVQRGVELAEEDLEKAFEAGLYPYELQIEVLDTRSDPERAARLLAEFYDRGGTAALGGVSDAEAMAMAPVAEEAGRVLLSPTASSSAVPASRYVYRLFPTARREANKMANFATLELGLRRVGILTVDTAEAAAGDAAREAAEAFREELERNGGKVVSRGTIPAAEKVSEPAVAKAASDVLAGDPQAVYVAAFTARARAVVKALDRRGYRGVVLTTSALSAPGLLESTASAADGALLTQTMFEPESAEPEVALFVNAYRQRWNRDPDLYAAHGYDALKVLARALEAEHGRSRQLWQGVRGLDGVRGVTGFLQFNEKGEAGKFPRVYVVDGGRLDPVEGMPEWKRQRLAGR